MKFSRSGKAHGLMGKVTDDGIVAEVPPPIPESFFGALYITPLYFNNAYFP
jgi:hypothetical protein